LLADEEAHNALANKITLAHASGAAE